MDALINNGMNFRKWMETGKRILTTRIIANSVHEYFETQNELRIRNILPPVEQKRYRRSSHGRTNELLISKIVLTDLRRDTLIWK